MSDESEIPIYTVDEFAEKVQRDYGGSDIGIGIFSAIVLGLERELINGVPCLVVYHASEDGAFGVILNRRYADELTKLLGPHPMVEAFFRLH
jgi:hypothetical protein